MSDNEAGICILSGIYPPDSGGPSNFAFTFSRFATENGFSATVCSYTDGESRCHLQDSVEVSLISRRLKLPFRYLRMILQILRNSKKGLRILANGCFVEIAIATYVKRLDYVTKVPGDIVWERARNLGATQLSIEEFQSAPLNFKMKIFRYLFHRALRYSKYVIVPSRQLAEFCLRWGVESEKIILIPNSISTELFKPGPSQNKTFDFICVSRLVPWKGIQEVVKAAIALNCSLLIIGDGPEKESLEQLTFGYSDKIKFTGSLGSGEIIAHLQESRVFVLNSSFEATSYALLEAMAVGIPGIANYKTGSEEIITSDVDGILCRGNPAKSVYQAMEFALANPNLINEMGKRAREKIISEFDVETNFRKIISVLQ